MAYVYILKNKQSRYYTGITELKVDKRLERHNKGDVFSTKLGRPWELIHFEFYRTLKEARDREKQIKNWKGGNAFKKLVSKAAGSANGRPHDSESCNPGSNPGPAAL